MSNATLAETLTNNLNLDTPPIAVAFTDAPPAGIKAAPPKTPSACAFWREAEKGVFYAPAEAHFNCPVGSFVMGFDLPKHVSDELMELVGTMTKCGYIGVEEPGAITTNAKKGAKGVLYGPLADFPVAPDAVLAWLSPAQAMIFSEAGGGADWTGTPSTVFGRPACAAVPSALANGKSSLSLGCAGMRTFTGIDESKMLAVISGANLDSAAAKVAQMRAVNNGMEAFYRDRAASLAG